MNILSAAIVSNSDMIKNYKLCREKAEIYGHVFILKNNRPNAVLFSIAKYESLAGVVEQPAACDQNPQTGSLKRRKNNNRNNTL